MKKFLLTLLIAVLSVGVSHAASQTVTLKSSEICPPSDAVMQYGNPKNYTNGGVDFICAFNHSYSWAVKKQSFATSVMQFKKDKNCGIVSKSTIGKIVKISANVTKNSVKVYASNSAYSEYQTTSGVLIGTLSTENKELSFDKEYKYISIQENGVSAEINDIVIEYETSSTSGPSDSNASFDDKNLVYEPGLKVVPTFTPSDLANITYEPQTGGDNVLDAELNVLRAGTQKVKATWSASEQYTAGSAEFTVTVAKADVTLAYDNTEYSVLSTEVAPEFPVLTAPEGIAVSYASDNQNVAVVSTTGAVTIVGIGTANITATFAGNDCYKEASASYKLVVIDDSKVQTPTFVDAPGTYPPGTYIRSNCATEGVTFHFILSKSATPDMSGAINEFNPQYGIGLPEEGTWYLHIWATKEGKTDSDILTGCFVIERCEADFAFAKESETIQFGETTIYQPSMKGYDLDGMVEYTVDKPEVLQVMSLKYGEAPRFIVLRPGTATITANLTSEAYFDATSTMTVTVTPEHKTTTFDFTKLSEDGETVYTMTPTTDGNYYIENQPESLNGYSFQDYDGKVTIETIKGDGSGSRLWCSTNGNYTWRVYKDVSIKITAPENCRIIDIKFTGTGSTSKLSVDKAYGTFSNGVFSSGDNINNYVEFTLTGTLEAKTIEVKYYSTSDNRYTNALSFDKTSYTIYADEELPVAKFENESELKIHYLFNGEAYTPGDKLKKSGFLEAYTELTETYYTSYASTYVSILEIPAITKLNLHYTQYPNNSSPYYKTYITADVVDGVAEFNNVVVGNNAIVNPEVDGVTIQLSCAEAYFSAPTPGNEEKAIEEFPTSADFAKSYYLYTPLAGDKTLVGQNDDLAAVKINGPGTIPDELALYGMFDCFAVPGDKAYNITVSGLNTSKPKVLFHYVGEVTGVDNVSAADNGVVEYFNLQGVRVDEPANGIFIRRQGDKTSKVYIR